MILHMQARKSYARCYFSRPHFIQLRYSRVYRMGFVEWYIYLFIYSLKEKKTL